MTSVRTAGTLRLADDLELTRVGFGAMQLAGPMAWGPPEDPGKAAAVLRAVIELGINHIDTSDYYGPHTVNQLIRETLHPYPEGLHLVTKVGGSRAPDKSWPAALGRDQLVRAVHDNLERLDLPVLDLVHLRMTDTLEPDDITEPFTVLAELQQEGLIRHLGVSNVSAGQIAVARKIAPVLSVQNAYNVIRRGDEDVLAECEERGSAFVPFFPVRGFKPEQGAALAEIAGDVGVSSTRLALAWLLQHSPVTLLIPGTSSVSHLEDNVAASELTLDAETLRRLDALRTDARGLPWG
ncbi:oxidoreductase [Amycolatopsis sp. WQ 127309]|uniref:oxidoreductase n=1 Tax=Amycolatopsis sp. WQ 127309 TaxID=2932773 RepID=UPI001FF5418A|nr:oxidoreductase [Amycolatopsis sp. WQ 127309]UOZ03442.1 oxidoreductase [Amycolatopsis sp. WQ 127309]